MAQYLALQIFRGNLDYDEVIAKYPNLRDAIDATLENLKNESR